MDRNKLKFNFINKAKQIHKDENLDYSEIEYVNNRTPVKIIDHDIRPDGTEYGEFWQTPSNHLKGQCHPDKRGLRISKSKLSSQSEIIKRFKEVHKGENLDYSEVKYKGMHVKVKIISHDLRPDGTEYGEFWQEPIVHLKGSTHPEIGKAKQVESHRYTTETFIRKLKSLYNCNDLDFSKVKYITSQTKVTVICNKCNNKGIRHGEFQICPDALLQGKSCPKCGNHKSDAEDEIINFIKNKSNLIIEQRNHSILKNKEVDIYLPQKNIAFEYNGLRWHSEQFGKDKHYHISKKNECEAIGIRLFHIFEDEYIYHKEALLKKISRILNLEENLPIVNVEKCDIRETTNDCAESFLNFNDIQGYYNATIHIGMFYNGKLISLMSFTKQLNDEWILVRFSDDIHYKVIGSFSAMLNFFIKNYCYKTIRAFIDRRWESDEVNYLYTENGFVKDKINDVSYSYTNGHGKRINKDDFKKQISLGKNKMENSDYYKIWDCGSIEYVLNKNY